MENQNPIETPIEIINPGNGMPGAAPCSSVPIVCKDLITGGGCGDYCSNPIPVCERWLLF